MNVVFHQAALGDFALVLSTIRRLPGPTTLVVPWSHGRVAVWLAPELRVMDAELFEFSRLWAEGGPSTLSPAVQALFDEARLIVSLVADAKSAWAANVKRLASSADLVCVPPRPPASWERHGTEWHAAALDQAGLQPALSGTTSTEPAGSGWLIHPGSGGVDKCWPLDRLLAIAERLQSRGVIVSWLVGDAEAERGLLGRLLDQVDGAGVTHARDADTMLRAMQGVSHYLGNDAGPTHVAAQLGLHTTALFGPTDPRVWAPVGPRVTVVAPQEPGPMAWLSVDHLTERLNASA